MENSIEEIKKQLELILKVRKEQKEIIECAGGSCINCDPDIKALTESIDILSDYKRVLKENEELEEINNELEAEKNEAIRRYNFESIPVSLVEETIGELNKAYEDSKDENGESEYYYPDYTIRVLEELLEKRK